ncbi:MAG TPA: flagellar hook capping FlgD N-terminal domain-containing protein [Solirubrobacteraceae bacterium]|jgi:flagellar basal-body rod modification protein FlgD
MTVIPPTSSGTPAANTQASNSNAGVLGKDDFLKLFVAQLQNQDPTSSQDPSQSMQQMAQFSEIEQITNLVSQQNETSAVGLLGKTVTYKDKAGVHTGTVEKVNTSAQGAPTLTVAGIGSVDPSSITQVA